MKVLKLIILLLLVVNLSQAQSPFKRMPKPTMKYSVGMNGVVAVNPEVTAFRFVSPILGYTTLGQIVTGSGFGYNRMHFVDSTQRYYTDFSLNGMIYAGGRVAPSIDPNNIMSVGISAAFLNQLIMVGGAYNLPLIAGTKGKIVGVLSIQVPLN